MFYVSKTWKTKRKILSIISREAKTPSEISNELNLAPSTVSEHMEELERMGAIKQVDNPFIKKWKYYKVNPDFDSKHIGGTRLPVGVPQAAAVFVIILGLLGVLAFGASSVGGGGQQVLFSLTDPPSVPNGTQSLNIAYSSIQAHYVGSEGSSGWISGAGSGSLDLMNLINTSQVIGTGQFPANSTIDMVRFTIASANIVINGTSYNVTVPSGQLTTSVSGTKVGTNSSVLIDMSPVVAAIYTSNSTIFVLVPSLKAVMVGGTLLNSRAYIGERHRLSSEEQDKLNETAPSISISSATLKVIGNSTVQLSVTVKNTGNENATLRHAVLNGMPSVLVEPDEVVRANVSVKNNVEAPPAFVQLNSSAAAPLVGRSIANGEMDNSIRVMTANHGNVSVESELPSLNSTAQTRLKTLVRVGEDVRMFRVLNFLIASNGTLVLPFENKGCSCTGLRCPAIPASGNIPCIVGGLGENKGFGYVLQPGASATFTFSGQLIFGGGRIRITPVQGSRWTLAVAGEEGAEASTNVTVVGG